MRIVNRAIVRMDFGQTGPIVLRVGVDADSEMKRKRFASSEENVCTGAPADRSSGSVPVPGACVADTACGGCLSHAPNNALLPALVNVLGPASRRIFYFLSNQMRWILSLSSPWAAGIGHDWGALSQQPRVPGSQLTGIWMSETIQRIIRVEGRVQGVYYRASAAAFASERNARGYVRNLSDGSVEIVVRASPEIIDEMLVWAQKGPPAARVDRVDVRESTEELSEPGFSVRYS